MRRHHAGLLVLLVLLAAACHSSDPIRVGSGYVHWMSTSTSLERQLNVVVPAQFASDGAFMRGVNSGVLQANRSPYINAAIDVPNVAPTACPDRHCIVIARRSMNGGLTAFGWDSTGHMYGLAARIWFDSAPWSAAVLANAVCHEIFHALGLAHSSDGTQGPCQGGVATDHDLSNIKKTTGHRDATIYGGPSLAAAGEDRLKPVKLDRVHRHTRAEYERMARES